MQQHSLHVLDIYYCEREIFMQPYSPENTTDTELKPPCVHAQLVLGILHQTFKLFSPFSLPHTMIEEASTYNLVFVL